jgi:hypothetical protein
MFLQVERKMQAGDAGADNSDMASHVVFSPSDRLF